MGLPKQNIPQSQKNEEWIKTCLAAINTDVAASNWYLDKDRICWAMYWGDQDETSYDYLRRVGEYEYPAYVRFVPLLRPKLDKLRSEYTQRPFDFSVFTVDQRSVDDKAEQQVRAFMSQIKATLFDKFNNLNKASEQVSQILAQQQQSEQQAIAAQQQGIAPPPQQGLVMDAQQAAQVEVFQEVLRDQSWLSKKDLEKIDQLHGLEGRQLHEMIAQSAVEYLMHTQDLEQTFAEGWQNKLITDKTIFHVDWDNPYEDPFVRTVDTKYFHYAHDNEVDWVQNAEWARSDMYMSVGTVIDRFRYDLSEEDLDKLESKRSMSTSSSYDSWNSTQGQSSWINQGGVMQPWSDPVNLIKVSYTVFRSPRAVHWKKTPHTYLPGEYFEHIIDESDIPPPSQRKKDVKYETFYLDDLYEGYEIDDGIFVRLRRKPAQLRGVDKYGKVDLPFVGPAFRSKNRKPYSLMWRAKDIQILWNIMHFHKELWVALSGVKGFVMDKSQKPDDMSMAEWIYQKKMGVGWIQSDKKGRQFSFNQFKTYDDSLSPGIQYLLQIIQHLDDLAGKVTGITANRMGQISKSDQVGTVERSIRESSMTTEINFWEYDLTKVKVMERLVNLCRLAWKKGKRGAYVLGNMQQKLLNVPAGIFSSAEYRLFIKNAFTDQKKIQELRQIALSERNKNALTAQGLVQVFTLDNLNEIEKAINDYTEKATELEQQNMQQQHMNAMELEEQKKQGLLEVEENKARLEAEVKQAADQFNQQIETQKGLLEEARLQWEQERFALELELEKAKIDVGIASEQMDHQAKTADTESERITEFAYLDEQKRSTDIDTMVKLIQLRMQENQTKEQNELKIKDIETKIKVGNTKEKIKDRNPTK